MEQKYLLINFILVLVSYFFLKYQKTREKQDSENHEKFYRYLTSQIKKSSMNYIDFSKNKGEYINILTAFLSRYENMLFNEYHDNGYEKIYSTRNEKLTLLAESYYSKNPEAIYDALSEMTKSVMKVGKNLQYYSKYEFLEDLSRISQLLRNGDYWGARNTLTNISKKNTDSDIIFITFLLRYGAAELSYNYWPVNKNRISLASNIAKWIDFISMSLKKDDKISTLKYIDYLYGDIINLKHKYKVDVAC